MLDLTKIVDIEFDGIDHSDYPDYSDVFISRAFIKEDGHWLELTDKELDWLNDQREFVYEKLMEWIH